MAKEQFKKRILDYWEAPDDAGEAIGCLCTSFTFHADLFEEECLGRFLGLDSDPKEEADFYLVELETKLAQMGNITIFVDSRHSKGIRSPRWNLLPVHVPGGAFHPKLQVLIWSNHVRIIVGSANITREGYRFNDELFYVVDYHKDAEADKDFANECLSFFSIINSYGGWSDDLKSSISKLINQTKSLLSKFSLIEPPLKYIFTGVLPGSDSIFDQIKEFTGNKIFDAAYIKSPSFDQPGTKNEPAEQIWSLLKQRGDTQVVYQLRGRKTESTKEIEIFAPEELLTSKPKKESASVYIELNNEIIDGYVRSAHSKVLELIGDSWRCITIGSSNFSRPGLGIKTKGKSPVNFEANVSFLVPHGFDRKIESHLDDLFKEHEEVDFDNYKVSWLSDNISLGNEQDQEAYPSFISYIEFTKDGEDSFYKIGLNEKNITFKVKVPKELASLLEVDGSKELTYRIPIKFPHSELVICWDNHQYNYPVYITAQSSLPTPDYLANLTLEEITELLSSNLPLQRAFKKLYLKKKAIEERQVLEISDPHKRANTSGFILQRTRQFSWALNAFKKRIEEPVFTEEAFDWKITGPIGIISIKNCLLRPFEKPDEKAFFLTEIISTLKSVTPSKQTGCLDEKIIKKKVGLIIKSLEKELKDYLPNISDTMKDYINVTGERYVK